MKPGSHCRGSKGRGWVMGLSLRADLMILVFSNPEDSVVSCCAEPEFSGHGWWVSDRCRTPSR